MFQVLEVDIRLLHCDFQLTVNSVYIVWFCFICHLQLFTGIYGCGPSTAHKWYDLGHRTIKDIKDNAELLNLNVQQKYGKW